MYACKVEYKGNIYDNSESAYKASKSNDYLVRLKFLNLSGKEAKRLGRQINLNSDFEANKITIMYEINKSKFLGNSYLKEKLIDTYQRELQEGNWWGRYFLGSM